MHSMAAIRRLILIAFCLSSTTSPAQPGFEGYWGRSEIKVRLSTPETVHTAPLDLSPRYVEADTLPPSSVELMDLRQQINERAHALGDRLLQLPFPDKMKVLDAYVRINLRLIGGDYEPGKVRLFRDAGSDTYHFVSRQYAEQFWRPSEPDMNDRDEHDRLRDAKPGVEIPDADAEADWKLIQRHLPMDFATHLDLLGGKSVQDESVREAITAAERARSANGYAPSVIVNYLRYNYARRLIARSPLYPEDPEARAQRSREITEAKDMLHAVCSASVSLSLPALHKLADAEFAAFNLAPNDKKSLPKLEECFHLLRLCKEAGDPTAVGSAADIVRNLDRRSYLLTFADLSERPETRAAVATYAIIPGRGSPVRQHPNQISQESAWVAKLESLGLINDASLIRLAAGLHDAGARNACERVLALCPQDDGVVRLIRAHFALERKDRDGAFRHLQAAEQDLRTKARRHAIILSEHSEYGLKHETKMMYGRVLVEQASLLLLRDDFLGAARKLRQTGMDLFNQEYVLGCLLTTTELKQLADEEKFDVHGLYHWTQDEPEEAGPMVRRDPLGVTAFDSIHKTHYSSARIILAQRLLQEGRARESLPYWDFGSLPDARRYADLLDVARDASRPVQERGLAHWQAGMILRKNPDLWACPAGHALVSGEFVPPVVVTNRASIKDKTIVGPGEHARIDAAKKWTAPRNSFFRYGLAEHCLKASELLQGEQSAYALWFGALALAFIDRQAAEPMRQKLLKEYASTKIGRQALAVKGLPEHVEAPDMK